jgi:hypothetical protein
MKYYLNEVYHLSKAGLLFTEGEQISILTKEPLWPVIKGEFSLKRPEC